ncbi:hypothetical protein P153DRAFT_369291 [Dothidotthia symphoricarpi CBS 119687]|uniref:Cell wall mannoprotein PIR1-like C-terminal domain-containing protein n=1 Tax=Dothidotthia symphoricarpi CBS 119687 TaxID=1392245 RepID=A0A6A6A695_9PLEO|nr:uncharacterized protein P153DRAFT_369291 [Dothidotthia symphoricarpi CBS 119687]KAF2126594.1 hypothetical protein P153DRAFT_369291 [Dothidotthia symphoricarpi CBS 119687]
MRASDFFAVLFAASGALAQVAEGIAPDASAPDGCVTTSDGNFTIGVLRDFAKRADVVATAEQAVDGALICHLTDGVLKDQHGRVGSIVANQQFQFDGPPQAGAIYTGGFSVCGNDSLAIGGTTQWWKCSSGAFYNLYDQWIGDQCVEIRIQAAYVDSSGSSTSTISDSSASATGSASSTASGDSTSASGASSTKHSSATASSAGSTASGTSSTSSAQNSAAPAASAGAGVTSRMYTGASLAAVMAILGAALVL